MVNSNVRKYKANYNRTIMEDNVHSPQQFWKMAKKRYPMWDKSSARTTTLDISRKLTTNKRTIANPFCVHYSTCAEKLCKTLPPIFNWKNERDLNQTNTHFLIHTTPTKKVLRHLLNLKSTKAPGHDKLPPKMLRRSPVYSGTFNIRHK